MQGRRCELTLLFSLLFVTLREKDGMDSITHLALGSLTGELIGRQKLGRSALVAGAMANVFPDIDVIAALWLDPADNVLFHRGITHSIFTNLVFAIAFSWLISRYRKEPGEWSF